MDFLMGFIVGFGLVTSIYTIIKYNKTTGIAGLIFTIMSYVSMEYFLSSKASHAFGGSDFSYLIQCMKEKWALPYLVVIIYIILLVFVSLNTYQMIKGIIEELKK